jgi:hypothetical protein
VAFIDGGAVTMSATTALFVVGNSVPKPIPLIDQIQGVLGQDPALLGATGYMDDVFPTRLSGDID